MKEASLQLAEELTNSTQQYAHFNPYYQTDFNSANAKIMTPPIDFRQSFAIDVNPISKKKFSMHCKQLAANLYLLSGFALILYLLLNEKEEQDHRIVIAIIFSFIYLSYIGIIVQNNPQMGFLSNLKKGEIFEFEYERNRSKKGMFKFNAECYHMQKKQSYRSVTNSRGNIIKQKQVDEQKVVTFTANETFSPKKIYDQSGTIDRIRSSSNIVFVQFKAQYTFKDQQDSKKFDLEYQRFKEKNKRNKFQNYSYLYVVPDLNQRLAFYAGNLSCNLKYWYLICLFLGIVWPFSVWLECKIQRLQIIYKHELTL